MARLLFCIVSALTVAQSASITSSQPNPYGVSGANWAANGVMEKLDMPAGTLAYIWDELQPTNTVQMVRPCRYWEYVSPSTPHKAHGYHEATDTIHDATAFGLWVDANPGRIWIIGNEPDLDPIQDGLSTEEYARMYHRYYTFIQPRDPTAMFGVAGLSGDLPPSRVQGAINWWEAVLTSYETQFGSLPHIDIWNYHCYSMPWQIDAVKAVEDYAVPFKQWVETVRDGEYAPAEIWCTEFGVGLWGGMMNREVIAPYMKQLCPRLEAAGVDRFFWFLGPWANWDPTYMELSLLDASGAKTLLGTIYSGLASTYPNPTPTALPNPDLRPLPPGVIRDDFSDGNTDGWFIKAGKWIADGTSFRQHTVPNGSACYSSLNHEFWDGTYEADLRINETGGDNSRWAGFTLRQQGNTDSLAQSGYLVLVRANGELAIHTDTDGTVASAAGAVPGATTGWNHLKVELQEYEFKVWMNGVLKLSWTDNNKRWRHGRFNLEVGRTDSSFDNVIIDTRPVR